MEQGANRQGGNFIRTFSQGFSHFGAKNGNPFTVIGTGPRKAAFHNIQHRSYGLDK
jgi:hypothetical protein